MDRPLALCGKRLCGAGFFIVGFLFSAGRDRRQFSGVRQGGTVGVRQTVGSAKVELSVEKGVKMTSFRKFFARSAATLAGCGLLAIAAPAALAQGGAPVQNPSSLITDFSAQSVGPVLNELGVVWQKQEANGQSYLAANAGGEITFLLVPAACKGANKSHCVGLSMVAIFDGNANPQTVSAFNYRYAFASAGLDPSGSAYIKRYEISDYGVPRGNLATSILVFVEQARMLHGELATSRQTVAQQGYADDMASGSLNRGGISTLYGVDFQPVSPIDQHQVGLDDTAEQIKFFIANRTTPRNKISNFSK